MLHWEADGRNYTRYAIGPVHDLAVADDGTVWAGTSSGVSRFDGDTWTTYDTADGLPSQRVRSLAVHEGTVWAFTEPPSSRAHGGNGKGVACFHEGQWASWAVDDGLPSAELGPVTVAADGTVWALTSPEAETQGDADDGHGGIARLDRRGWTTWTNEELPGDTVVQLTTGANGSVWAISSYDPSASRDRAEDEGIADDKDSLLRFTGSGWETVAPSREIPDDEILSLAVDDRGRAWLATAANNEHVFRLTGVRRFDGQGWTSFTHNTGLPHNWVYSLTTSQDGTVWAATDAGAARFADGTWKTYATGVGPPGIVHAVAVDDAGAVWAGGSSGVSRFDGDQWTRWTAADGLAHNVVGALAISDDGSVWTGTPSGVSRLQGGDWTSWTADGQLPVGRVTAIAAVDGAAWALMDSGPPGGAFAEQRTDVGIAHFDGQTWTGWMGDAMPLSGEPVAVTADRSGAAWVAFQPAHHDDADEQTGGVARFQDGTWTAYTTADGLPSNTVNALAAVDGVVWAATSQGLARYDGQTWIRQTESARSGLSPAASGSEMLAVGPDGVLWGKGIFEGDEQHIARLDGATWTTYSLLDWRPTHHVQGLAVNDDAVWLGLGTRQLRRFDPP